jgi:ribose 5-phosphate isomerase B
MSIAANRHSHIRAALCTNVFMAEMARAHNNANVITFGSNVSTNHGMKEMLTRFFDTDFEGGRHIQRLSKIS